MHNRMNTRQVYRSNVLPTYHYVRPKAVCLQHVTSEARPQSSAPLFACTWNVLKTPTEFIVGQRERERSQVIMSKCRTEDSISGHLAVKNQSFQVLSKKQSFQVYQHIKFSFILKCHPWNWNGRLVVEICPDNVYFVHWSHGKRPTDPPPVRLPWISGMFSWRGFQTHT